VSKTKTLLLCKEAHTFVQTFVAESLIEKGCEVTAFFIHTSESLFEDKTLQIFREKVGCDIDTVKDITVEFSKKYKEAYRYIDYDYLEYIERVFCSEDKPLNYYMVSSQLFTTPYHYRFYFRDLSDSEKLLWVQLVFKKVERVLDNLRPERVVDLEISTFFRTALWLVCKKRKIKYVNFEYSRYQNFWLPTYEIGRITDNYFKETYINLLSSSNLTAEVLEVETFRRSSHIQPDDYKNNNTSKREARSLPADFVQLLRSLKFLIGEWVKNFKHTGFFSEPPIVANYPKSLLFFVLCKLRERFLFSSICPYFEAPLEDEKYIFFPLHLIPESTTLNKSPYYPNETTVIEALSKSLPVNWKIYIKEHGSMIGERHLSFYRRIKRFSNVRLIKMNAYDDPKPWILKSKGVVTLSGSSAFEAAMLGKRSIIFGNTFFELIDGVKKVESFNELAQEIRLFCKPLNNSRSCAAYIKAVKNLGAEVKMAKVLNDCRESLLKDKPLVEHESCINSILDIMMRDR